MGKLVLGAVLGYLPGLALAGLGEAEQNNCLTDKPTVQVWLSPRMPYSFSEWPRLVALLQNLPNQPHVRVLMDSAVGAAEWQAAVQASNWPDTLKRTIRAASPCGSVAAATHFPSIHVSQGGRTHPWPIVGAMPSIQWQSELLQRLATLSTVSAQTPDRNPMQNATPAIAATGAPSACIPAAQAIPLQSVAPLSELGNYERISPDGRFVLRSFSGANIGQVALVELPRPSQTALKLHATPLRNEAFPVQGSWRFLVDVDGSHYRFSDVLRLAYEAKPLFKAGMTGFYAAASEMRTAEDAIHIRSLSWPQSDGNSPLGDGDDAAIGPLQLRTVRIADEWPTANRARVIGDTGPQYLCGQRSAADGQVYALPMLSIDASAFTAVPQSPRIGQPSMRSYALNTDAMANVHSCELTQDLGRAPSKAVFGFSDAATQKPWLVYTDNAQVVLHDTALNRAFTLSPVKHRQLASAFPGVTQDGRIIFAASWFECEAGDCPQQAGYLVLDPYQNLAYAAARQAAKLPAKTCITHAEVQRQRQRFADFHRIQGQSPP